MARRSVAIYLTLVLVAGPSLCCCRLAHWVSTPSTATAHGPASPATPPCPCCADEPASQSPAPSHDDSPKPPGHDCPCRQMSDSLVAVVDAAVDLLPEGAFSCFVGFLAVPSGDLLPAQVTATSADSSLPFWSAGDLLRAHHQLRC